MAAVDASRSIVDSSLLQAHRVVLTGLVPGTTYRFRVRSITAAGGAAVSAEGTLTTAASGTGPDILTTTIRQVTSTTATLGWSTSNGIVAQVEFGPTPNYGAFTLLKVFSSASAQEMTLSGLSPATRYHFRIKAWDGDGFLGASADATFSTAAAGTAILVGDQTLQTEHVSLSAGQAAIYQYVASQSGQASVIRIYIDTGTTTPVIRVALYADQDGAPGAILSQGSAPGLVTGWTAVSIPPVSVIESTRYWIAVLSPLGAGNLNLRQALSGGSSAISSQTALAAFPQTWVGGVSGARSPVSAYAQQVPPAVSLTGPSEASVVNGKVQLSAVVDDDALLARVQFFVDGVPVGAPVSTAPYSVTWDSTGLNPNVPHTLSAQAFDVLGRSGGSAPVTVQVDNGPLISAVTMSGGPTATSARITWSTNILSDAQVEFGPTPAYGASTPIDSRPDWRHEMMLTGLQPATLYHYRVRSRDANGALAVSPDQVFFTPEP